LALTLAEREEISRTLASEHTIRSIAIALDRAPSTISREIFRNGGQSCYRANQADHAAWNRAHCPKTCKLAKNHSLERIVVAKLQCLWSPEQIAGWLKCAYPDEENNQVSHETIYHSLFIQARGVLKKELCNICDVREPCAIRVTTLKNQTIVAESLVQYRSATALPH